MKRGNGSSTMSSQPNHGPRKESPAQSSPALPRLQPSQQSEEPKPEQQPSKHFQADTRTDSSHPTPLILPLSSGLRAAVNSPTTESYLPTPSLHAAEAYNTENTGELLNLPPVDFSSDQLLPLESYYSLEELLRIPNIEELLNMNILGNMMSSGHLHEAQSILIGGNSSDSPRDAHGGDKEATAVFGSARSTSESGAPLPIVPTFSLNPALAGANVLSNLGTIMLDHVGPIPPGNRSMEKIAPSQDPKDLNTEPENQQYSTEKKPKQLQSGQDVVAEPSPNQEASERGPSPSDMVFISRDSKLGSMARGMAQSVQPHKVRDDISAEEAPHRSPAIPSYPSPSSMSSTQNGIFPTSPKNNEHTGVSMAAPLAGGNTAFLFGTSTDPHTENRLAVPVASPDLALKRGLRIPVANVAGANQHTSMMICANQKYLGSPSEMPRNDAHLAANRTELMRIIGEPAYQGAGKIAASLKASRNLPQAGLPSRSSPLAIPHQATASGTHSDAIRNIGHTEPRAWMLNPPKASLAPNQAPNPEQHPEIPVPSRSLMADIVDKYLNPTPARRRDPGYNAELDNSKEAAASMGLSPSPLSKACEGANLKEAGRKGAQASAGNKSTPSMYKESPAERVDRYRSLWGLLEPHDTLEFTVEDVIRSRFLIQAGPHVTAAFSEEDEELSSPNKNGANERDTCSNKPLEHSDSVDPSHVEPLVKPSDETQSAGAAKVADKPGENAAEGNPFVLAEAVDKSGPFEVMTLLRAEFQRRGIRSSSLRPKVEVKIREHYGYSVDHPIRNMLRKHRIMFEACVVSHVFRDAMRVGEVFTDFEDASVIVSSQSQTAVRRALSHQLCEDIGSRILRSIDLWDDDLKMYFPLLNHVGALPPASVESGKKRKAKNALPRVTSRLQLQVSTPDHILAESAKKRQGVENRLQELQRLQQAHWVHVNDLKRRLGDVEKLLVASEQEFFTLQKSFKNSVNEQAKLAKHVSKDQPKREGQQPAVSVIKNEVEEVPDDSRGDGDDDDSAKSAEIAESKDDNRAEKT